MGLHLPQVMLLYSVALFSEALDKSLFTSISRVNSYTDWPELLMYKPALHQIMWDYF